MTCSTRLCWGPLGALGKPLRISMRNGDGGSPMCGAGAHRSTWRLSVHSGCCCARPECRMTRTGRCHRFYSDSTHCHVRTAWRGSHPEDAGPAPALPAAPLTHRLGRASTSSLVARARQPPTVLARPEPLFCACPLTSLADRLRHPPAFLPSLCC